MNVFPGVCSGQKRVWEYLELELGWLRATMGFRELRLLCKNKYSKLASQSLHPHPLLRQVLVYIPNSLEFSV